MADYRLYFCGEDLVRVTTSNKDYSVLHTLPVRNKKNIVSMVCPKEIVRYLGERKLDVLFEVVVYDSHYFNHHSKGLGKLVKFLVEGKLKYYHLDSLYEKCANLYKDTVYLIDGDTFLALGFFHRLLSEYESIAMSYKQSGLPCNSLALCSTSRLGIPLSESFVIMQYCKQHSNEYTGIGNKFRTLVDLQDTKGIHNLYRWCFNEQCIEKSESN